MVSEKIKKINDILEDLKIGNMGLHYLVDLGKISRDTFLEKDKIEENFIHGCTSFAWIKLESRDPIQIRTVSDSMIVGGMLVLLEQTFNGEPKSSIEPYEGQDLIDGFGLDGHISTQRLRGFAEAVKMMKGTNGKNSIQNS
jgi:sulfur transfer protein SufE